MKLPSIALALFGLFAAHLHAAAPVRMDVEQHSSTKPAGVKAETTVVITKRGQSTKGEKTQRRSLTIKLSNNSAELVDGLVVKYFFLGHDAKDHKIKVLKAGERKAAIPAHGIEKVESEDVAINYTEAHTEVSKGKEKEKAARAARRKFPPPAKKLRVTP